MQNADLILMLQLCPRDQEEAMDLLQLIVDIEPEIRTDVEFCIAVRRDVEDGFANAMKRIAQKRFNKVIVIKSQRYGQAWPCGPNDLFQDGMMQLCEALQYGNITSKAVLAFEPDCCPLRPDWINQLKIAWKMAVEEGSEITGSLVSEGDKWEHINGNCILLVEMLKKYPALCSAKGAWDTDHRALLLSVARPTLVIHQMYQRQTEVVEEEIFALQTSWRQPALLHGVKNSSVRDIVRKMVEEQKFNIPIQSEYYEHWIQDKQHDYRDPARLAIAIFFQEGDNHAQALLDVLAGTQTQARGDIELILLKQSDTEIDKSRVKAVFPRYFEINTKKRGAKEDLWQDAMRMFARMSKSGSMTASGVFVISSDSIPMRGDWLDQSIYQWEQAKAEGKLIAGHFDDGERLNLSGIFDPQIVAKHPNLMVLTKHAGTDYRHTKFIAPNTLQSHAIYHIYPLKNVGMDKLRSLRKNGEVPAILNGIDPRLGIPAAKELLSIR